MRSILAGTVAWYVTGRFYVGADGSIQDVGYFLHLHGVGAPMFAGEPGEATAHFTFASEPFRAATLANGDLRLALDTVGDFRLFYARRPAATFDDPLSFAAGEEIARFRRESLVMGVTVEDGDAAPLALNVFSARPVSTAEFEVAGRRHDLGRTLPHGVTQWGTAGGRPLPPPAGFTSVMPFVGSAIAIGG